MLRYHSYNIVFQEVPNELSLAINISHCPNRCKSCHSPYLQENTGSILDTGVLDTLLGKYGNAITCVCFMGGDSDPGLVEKLAAYTRSITDKRLKTAWYSGRSKLPDHCNLTHFNYVKLGPYVEDLGGLNSPQTNQRFYVVNEGMLTYANHLFVLKRHEMI